MCGTIIRGMCVRGGGIDIDKKEGKGGKGGGGGGGSPPQTKFNVKTLLVYRAFYILNP
jgi:hypothetical protein